jgi:predicted nucleotidyltransferase
MVYTIAEIKDIVGPIASKYSLHSVYVFGSYARNEATENSDLDLLADISDSKVKGWILGELYEELCESFEKKIDLVTTSTLHKTQTSEKFNSTVLGERVSIYEQ